MLDQFNNEESEDGREDPYFYSDWMLILMVAFSFGYGLGYFMRPYYSSVKRNSKK